MKLVIPPGPFDALIFDCDGTIADTMPLHLIAWKAELSRWGCDFPLELFYGWAGTPTEKVVEKLNAKFGLSMPPQEVAFRKEENYYELLPQLKPIPAVVEQIDLHHGKLPMAVASGSHRESVERTLTTLGLMDRFDAFVTAEDCANGKPAPDVFLEAARRLGKSPANCLVFEDAELGIQAAEAAGMKWVRVPITAAI